MRFVSLAEGKSGELADNPGKYRGFTLAEAKQYFEQLPTARERQHEPATPRVTLAVVLNGLGRRTMRLSSAVATQGSWRLREPR